VDISFDAPQAVQLDGDHIGEARHLTMTVHPGALLIRWAAANSLSRT
jgi:diacylglycerol kinase family enzyme